MALEVRYSAEAADQLAVLRTRAEARPDGADATVYHAYAHAIREVIANPELARIPQNLLKGDLSGMCRVKVRGRLRIFYLVSTAMNRAIVLMFGFRKDGDKNDAYAVAARLLRRGAFDQHFAELGLKKPGA